MPRSRSHASRASDQLLVRVVVGVRFAGGPVVVGITAALGPHRLDAQTHPHLVVRDAADPPVQGQVGAVECDVPVDVRDFDVEIARLDVDDAEGGDGATGADLDPLGGRDAAGGAGAAGRDVHLAAGGAALTDRALLGERVDVV